MKPGKSTTAVGRGTLFAVLAGLFFATGRAAARQGAAAAYPFSSLSLIELGSGFVVEAEPLELSLADAVGLVLANNRELKTAKLSRASSLEGLRAARREFDSVLSAGAAAGYRSKTGRSPGTGEEKESALEAEAGLAVLRRLETGARVTLDWTTAFGDSDYRLKTAGSLFRDKEKTWSQTVSLAARQPLLRGSGRTVNRAALNAAEREDAVQDLRLREKLMDLVTDASIAYRELMRADRNRTIEEESLVRAEEQIKKISRLIEAGRLAEMDLTLGQADVASNHLRVVQAQNLFETVQLRLNKLLDAGPGKRTVPTEELGGIPPPPDFSRAIETALSNRPDFLAAVLEADIAALRALRAKDEREWGLDAEASVSQRLKDEGLPFPGGGAEGRENEWSVGLAATQEFGDARRDRNVRQGLLEVEKTRMALEDVRDNIAIEVEEGRLDISLKRRAWILAQTARELSEKKLEVELKKLSMGRSSAFQAVTFQNDEAESRRNELNAAIDYLNALTRFERTLGTTLDAWAAGPDEGTGAP